MSLNRHSIDFFDKVMKLLLISVCFYTQSAHKYHFIILKILVACMLVMNSDMESRTWYNYNISFRDMINDLVFYGFEKYSILCNRADFSLKND